MLLPSHHGRRYHHRRWPVYLLQFFRRQYPSFIQYIWVGKEHPSKSDFKLWRHAIRSLMDPSKVLRQPLGQWICSPHHRWEWFYNPDSDRIFQKCKEGWRIFHCSCDATRLHPVYVTSGAVVKIEVSLQFTTVTVLSSTAVQFEGSASSTERLDSSLEPFSSNCSCPDYWALA